MAGFPSIFPDKKQSPSLARFDWIRWLVGFVVLIASGSITLAMMESHRKFIYLLGFGALPFVLGFLRWPVAGIMSVSDVAGPDDPRFRKFVRSSVVKLFPP